MQKLAKRIAGGLAAIIIGGGLVFLGIAVWIDGNTGFGAGLGFVGILIVVAYIGNAVQARKKGRKSEPSEDEKSGQG